MATAAELLERSYSESIHERRATLLRAIDAADAENDVDLGFQIRMTYIRNCHNEAHGLHMIAHYGWCLARHDEDPERFSQQLWYYKWVVGSAMGFPNVSRRQLTELLDDMERRFDATGGSLGAVRKARLDAAISLGDTHLYEELFEDWYTGSKKGALNDCRACDVGDTAKYLAILDRHEEALDAGEPLTSGTLACATEPHYTLAKLMPSARAVGNLDLADDFHRRGLELLGSDTDFTALYGRHLSHLAVRGQVADGLALLRRTVDLVSGNDAVRLIWFTGARDLLLAADVSHDAADDLAELHQRVDGVADDLAKQFDARNGNTVFSDHIGSFDEAIRATA